MTRRESRFLLKSFIFVSVCILVIGYALFQSRHFIEGPSLVILTPSNGATLKGPFVIIEGRATNISSITLNNRNILVDQKGGFKEQLLLSEGYNVITIKAEDKFKRTVLKRLELIYNDNGV